MLDIDGVPAPEGVSVCSVEAVNYVISLLPDGFLAATCVYMFSNSAGIRNLDKSLFKEGIRVHLFFWFDRPVPGYLMAAYLENYCYDSGFYNVGLNKGGLPMVTPGIDMAPIRTSIQLHYTAQPKIYSGINVDITPGERLGMIQKNSDTVTIPLIDRDLPDTVARRRQQLREQWALENGFAKQVRRAETGRGSQHYEVLAREDSTVTMGRTLARTQMLVGGRTLQLFFEDEKSPGSWRVHKSRPWLASRYGDEMTVPTEELCPDALQEISRLGWMTVVPDGDAANLSDEHEEDDGIPVMEMGAFSLSRSGITIDTNTNEDKPPLYKWLSSPFWVVAKVRDITSTAWSYLIRLVNSEHRQQEIRIPATDLTSEQFRRDLMDAGVSCDTGVTARNQLAYFIQKYPTEEKRLLVQTTGWVEEECCFVLPDALFGMWSGGDNEKIMPAEACAQFWQGLRTSGTLPEWQEQVARLCEGNHLLVMALSAAFLAPLLKPLHLENLGVHIRGASSTGKSKALMIAASVWGNPLQYVNSWRATDNALETLANARNDGLLALDELAMVQPAAVAEAVYMLGNGQGKARMRSNGSARPVLTFRIVYLSSGEISLREHLAQVDKQAMGGHEVRFIDVSADAGAGMGVFQQLNGLPSPRELAVQFEEASSKFYGTAIRDFLWQLTSSPATVDEAVAYCNQIASVQQMLWQVPHSDPQVQRVCRHFAYLAAAGELAISYRILPMQPGAAIEACGWAFQHWLADRGGLESADLLQALNRMENNLHLYGFARFDKDLALCDTLKVKAVPPNPCWGLLTTTGADADNPNLEFLIPVRVFETVFCAGVSKKQFADLLVSRGFMDSPNTVRRTLPGVGQKRVYVVKGCILSGELPMVSEGNEAEEDQIVECV